jgi:hypothetical protein
VPVGFLKFLYDLGLESLTFLKHITGNQLGSFLEVVADMPTGGADGEFWMQLAEKRGWPAIKFNQHQYEIEMAQNLVRPAEVMAVAQESVRILSKYPPASAAQKKIDEFLDEFPQRIEAMFLKDNQDGIEQAAARLFLNLQDRQPSVRSKVIDVCQQLIKELDLTFQYDWIKFLADPILSALAAEKEPKIVAATATFRSRLVTHLIEFADYALASRIIINLQKQYRSLKEAKDARAYILANLLLPKKFFLFRTRPMLSFG